MKPEIHIPDPASGLLSMPPGLGENPPGSQLSIGSLIRALAARLDIADVPWAVLRQAEGLPDYTRYDVDLLTAPRHRAELLNTLEICAREHDWRIIGRILKRHYACLLLARITGVPASGEPSYLPVDVFTALEFRGLRYFEAEKVLHKRVRAANGIWTIPPGLEAAVTLFKEWLPHGILKHNSRAAVQARIAADHDGFRRAMSVAAGKELGWKLADLAERGEWRLPFATAQSLRRSLRRRQPAWPLDYARAVMFNLIHRFRPSIGMVVCLAGADGSGKTTLARGLFEQTYKRPFKAGRYIHGNSVVLPRFRDMRARLRRLAGGVPDAVENEHRTAEKPLKGMMDPVPPWKTVLLATYYAGDLILARLPLRRWRGQWALIVMDRSFYDYYYQLGHRRCPHWILNMLARVIPKPDLLLYIEGDPRQIHARKPELTVGEIQRQQNILGQMAERLPFARRINGTHGPEAMIKSGKQEVQTVLLQRNCRTLH